MPVLIEKARSFARQIVHLIEERMEFLRERLGGLLGTHPVYQGLVYTDEEKELILRTAAVMTEYFPEPPGQNLALEDYDSRCEAVEDFAARLAALYQFDGVELIITDAEDKFPDKDAAVTFGYAAFAENRIYINANCLRSDDPMILEHIVSTVIHEMRHLIQLGVAKMEKTYGVPYDRRHAWRVNIVNYIEAQYDMEGYMKQPIEFDARNFTNQVWQGAYGTGVQ